MQYLADSMSINGQSIEGPLQGINTVGDIVSKLMAFAIPFGGILFLLVFIWGGIDIITSQGSAEKWKTARLKITYAVIGFVLLATAFLLVKLIETIFGLRTGIF